MRLSLRKFILVIFTSATAFGLLGGTCLAKAVRADPSLEQRVADLEAYMANTGRGADAPGAGVASRIPGPGPGDNAWQMTASALVLFMTLPGLALSYGGLVRRKNVLSVLAQCLLLAGLVTILWWLCGYSLVFSRWNAGGGRSFIGSVRTFAFLGGVNSTPNGDYSFWVSHNVFSIYELMFAIITPAIIVGATAERMKFSAIMLFMTLWMFMVYFPLAHMVWGVDGFMNGLSNPRAGIRAVDFAGGMVVHMSSGWSALILCLLLGKRRGLGKEKLAPHSMVLCMAGTAMMWVGWYGFNPGSALAADGVAANAFMTTTLAAAVASFVWPMAEYFVQGKPSVLGFCSGAMGGLVMIAPAGGYVNATGAVIIGILGGLIPYFFVAKVKAWLGYDDALDAFGVHAVGGTLGVFLTGILATTEVNSKLGIHLAGIVGKTLWVEQLKAMGVTVLLAIVGTLVAGCIVKMFIGLRVTAEVESVGLDINEHGEEGYVL